MSRHWYDQSYEIKNVGPASRMDVFNWLAARQISHEFNAHDNTFSYVAMDREQAAALQKSFPGTQVVASAFQVSFKW